MLDVCGIVYIQVRDKRTSFAKYLKEIQRNGWNNTVEVHHKYFGRQEWGLGEACYGAALKFLQNAGIKGLSLWSNID
jgi:hypothetical protein